MHSSSYFVPTPKTIKSYWDGILNYFESRITNGILEGINSMVVNFYQVDVLKDLNVSRSLNLHFDSVIPASLAGVFLHLTFLPSWYVNPACSLLLQVYFYI